MNHPVEESLSYEEKATILPTALKDLHELTWAYFLISHSLATLHFEDNAIDF